MIITTGDSNKENYVCQDKTPKNKDVSEKEKINEIQGDNFTEKRELENVVSQVDEVVIVSDSDDGVEVSIRTKNETHRDISEERENTECGQTDMNNGNNESEYDSNKLERYKKTGFTGTDEYSEEEQLKKSQQGFPDKDYEETYLEYGKDGGSEITDSVSSSEDDGYQVDDLSTDSNKSWEIVSESEDEEKINDELVELEVNTDRREETEEMSQITKTNTRQTDSVEAKECYIENIQYNVEKIEPKDECDNEEEMVEGDLKKFNSTSEKLNTLLKSDIYKEDSDLQHQLCVKSNVSTDVESNKVEEKTDSECSVRKVIVCSDYIQPSLKPVKIVFFSEEIEETDRVDERVDKTDEGVENRGEEVENGDGGVENGDEEVENGDEGVGNGDEGVENGDEGVENGDGGVENGDEEVDNRDEGVDNRDEGVDNRDEGVDNRDEGVDNRDEEVERIEEAADTSDMAYEGSVREGMNRKGEGVMDKADKGMEKTEERVDKAGMDKDLETRAHTEYKILRDDADTEENFACDEERNLTQGSCDKKEEMNGLNEREAIMQSYRNRNSATKDDIFEDIMKTDGELRRREEVCLTAFLRRDERMNESDYCSEKENQNYEELYASSQKMDIPLDEVGMALSEERKDELNSAITLQESEGQVECSENDNMRQNVYVIPTIIVEMMDIPSEDVKKNSIDGQQEFREQSSYVIQKGYDSGSSSEVQFEDQSNHKDSNSSRDNLSEESDELPTGEEQNLEEKMSYFGALESEEETGKLLFRNDCSEQSMDQKNNRGYNTASDILENISQDISGVLSHEEQASNSQSDEEDSQLSKDDIYISESSSENLELLQDMKDDDYGDSERDLTDITDDEENDIAEHQNEIITSMNELKAEFLLKDEITRNNTTKTLSDDNT